MKLRQRLPIAISLMLGTIIAILATPTMEVAASTPTCGTAAECIRSGLDSSPTGTSGSVSDIIGTVVNVLLFLLGAVCVIMIIFGGFRYVTSKGDQSAVKAAKDTILYAVVGLIVAIAAYAIASFVVSYFVS